MTIKERIKELCNEHKISVAKLERECGFANGYISKLDKSTPNTAKIQKIADRFNVSVDYIMTGENSEGYYSKETAEIAQQIYQNRELHLLFDITRDSSPKELTDFANMILIMKKRERGE